jgi:anti-sigma B factor antagonist
MPDSNPPSSAGIEHSERAAERADDEGVECVQFHCETSTVAIGIDDHDVVVRVCGEIDVTSRELHNRVVDCVAGALKHGECTQVVVDMREVQFCDSTGIVLLLRLHRQAVDDGVALTLRQPSFAVRRLLKATGLRDLLEAT